MDVKKIMHGPITKVCPVCGERMKLTLCVDDLYRPYCTTCRRTYTPIGYSDGPGYGTRWTVTDLSTEESSILNIKKAEV